MDDWLGRQEAAGRRLAALAATIDDAHGIRVFLWLAARAHPMFGTVRTSEAQLSEALRTSPATIRRALAELRRLRAVTTERTGRGVQCTLTLYPPKHESDNTLTTSHPECGGLPHITLPETGADRSPVSARERSSASARDTFERSSASAPARPFYFPPDTRQKTQQQTADQESPVAAAAADFNRAREENRDMTRTRPSQPSAAWIRTDHPLVKALQAIGFAYDGPQGIVGLFATYWPGAVAAAYAHADETRDRAAPLNVGRVLGMLRENSAGWSPEQSAEALAAQGVSEPTRSRVARLCTPAEVAAAAAEVAAAANIRKPAGLLVRCIENGSAWERADKTRRDALARKHRQQDTRETELLRQKQAEEENRRVIEAKAQLDDALRVIEAAPYDALRSVVPEAFTAFMARQGDSPTPPPGWKPMSDPPTEDELRAAASLRSLRRIVAERLAAFAAAPRHDITDTPALPKEHAA